MLSRSPLFAWLAVRDAPPCNYVFTDCEYMMGYYLANSIYTPWTTSVKTTPHRKGNKRSLFNASRVDKEGCTESFWCASEVLWHHLCPAEYWKPKVLRKIMTRCILLHNLIIEDERGMPKNFRYKQGYIERESFRCASEALWHHL